MRKTARMTAFEALADTIGDTLLTPSENLTPDSVLETLPSWDSVNKLRILMALESRFSVKFPIKSFADCKTVGDMAAMVESCLQTGAAKR